MLTIKCPIAFILVIYFGVCLDNWELGSAIVFHVMPDPEKYTGSDLK